MKKCPANGNPTTSPHATTAGSPKPAPVQDNATPYTNLRKLYASGERDLLDVLSKFIHVSFVKVPPESVAMFAAGLLKEKLWVDVWQSSASTGSAWQLYLKAACDTSSAASFPIVKQIRDTIEKSGGKITGAWSRQYKDEGDNEGIKYHYDHFFGNTVRMILTTGDSESVKRMTFREMDANGKELRRVSIYLRHGSLVSFSWIGSGADYWSRDKEDKTRVYYKHGVDAHTGDNTMTSLFEFRANEDIMTSAHTGSHTGEDINGMDEVIIRQVHSMVASPSFETVEWGTTKLQFPTGVIEPNAASRVQHAKNFSAMGNLAKYGRPPTQQTMALEFERFGFRDESPAGMPDLRPHKLWCKHCHKSLFWMHMQPSGVWRVKRDSLIAHVGSLLHQTNIRVEGRCPKQQSIALEFERFGFLDESPAGIPDLRPYEFWCKHCCKPVVWKVKETSGVRYFSRTALVRHVGTLTHQTNSGKIVIVEGQASVHLENNEDDEEEREEEAVSLEPFGMTEHSKGIPSEAKTTMQGFASALEISQKSQQAIHDWDKKMGLVRSYSKTMQLSARSRKKLRASFEKEVVEELRSVVLGRSPILR
jgi:hypothetical protein